VSIFSLLTVTLLKLCCIVRKSHIYQTAAGRLQYSQVAVRQAEQEQSRLLTV